MTQVPWSLAWIWETGLVSPASSSGPKLVWPCEEWINTVDLSPRVSLFLCFPVSLPHKEKYGQRPAFYEKLIFFWGSLLSHSMLNYHLRQRHPQRAAMDGQSQALQWGLRRRNRVQRTCAFSAVFLNTLVEGRIRSREPELQLACISDASAAALSYLHSRMASGGQTWGESFHHSFSNSWQFIGCSHFRVETPSIQT